MCLQVVHLNLAPTQHKAHPHPSPKHNPHPSPKHNPHLLTPHPSPLLPHSSTLLLPHSSTPHLSPFPTLTTEALSPLPTPPSRPPHPTMATLAVDTTAMAVLWHLWQGLVLMWVGLLGMLSHMECLRLQVKFMCCGSQIYCRVVISN